MIISRNRVLYAETTRGMAEACDNLRASGVKKLRAEWDEASGVWKIEYQRPEGGEESDAG